MKRLIAFTLTALMLMPFSALFAAEATSLRCEYLNNPVGIDVTRPRLSWNLQEKGPASGVRGLRQTAYQVLVASTEELLKMDKGDLWDSGKVMSDQSNQVEYAGTPLVSRMQCHWKVRLWTASSGVEAGQDGKATEWSTPATWTMGLLKPEDWNAKWIAAMYGDSVVAGGGIGYHATEAAHEDDEKWVQVDLGKSVAIERIVLHALKHGEPDQLIKGFGFPLQFRIEASAEGDFKNPKLIANQTASDFPNPGHVAVPFAAQGVMARYVRVTATKLWNRKSGVNSYWFALKQLEVISSGENAAVQASVTSKDSVENGGWAKASLTDGLRYSSLTDVNYDDASPRLKPSATAQMRKEFTVDKKIKRAVTYVCGLGSYELRMNGRKVGDRVLEPGWTNYKKTSLYAAYDVKDQLLQGKNAMGISLGNGMYNVVGGRYTKFTGSFGSPTAIVQLYVEHTDGTSQMLVSDDSWTWSPSPVVFSCIYGGEEYDARMEQPGWDKGGYAAEGYYPVNVVDGLGGTLSSQAAPPIKVMQEFKPVTITEPKPGVRVYDFGQNCSSMPKLTVKGPAGAIIKMTPGEWLYDNGLVSQVSSGGPTYCTYTLKGGEKETWSPQFFYYGSRYLQVETSGHDGKPAPEVIELISQFVYSSAREVGKFSCSNEVVNRIHRMILAAFKSNLQSVLTDCPHREKLGWLECAHLLAGCVMCNFEAPTFYAKIVNDMHDAQLANGFVPNIALEYVAFKDGFRDSPEWGSAYVIAPWKVYEMYGDLTLLERHYEGMKRYVDYLKSKPTDHIVSHGLGDWFDMPWGQTSKGVTATAIFYQNLLVLKNAAELLGKTDEARQFEAQAQAVKEAFNQKFFKAEKNQYDYNSQTANSMPLVLVLVPEDRRSEVLAGLVAEIRAGGNRIKAGDVGFHYLMLALSDGGQGDVLYDMLTHDDGPGYVCQLNKGMTTLAEAWDAVTTSSLNHCMLGHIEEWFYRGLGGLTSDPSGPGFKKIMIKPQIVGDLEWVNCSYDSPDGQISSNWRREGKKLTMDITIPPNTTATVFVPAKDADSVTESSKPASEVTGVKFLRMENNVAVYAVGSGIYQFQSSLTKQK